MKDYRSMFLLKGKKVFVTGGAGLIGSEVSKALAASGAKTFILDVDRKKALRLERAINRIRGCKSRHTYFDITEAGSIAVNVRELIKKYGPCDAWVNTAYPKTKDWGDNLEALKSGSFCRNIDMHLNGYFLSSKEAAECMKRRRGGSIINFASTYGIVGPDFSIYKGTKMTTPPAYPAIKGGIIAFTKYMASYFGKYNIRINTVSPGGVYDGQPDVFVKRYSEKTPLRRIADKREIPGAVVYLASDASEYVTGHNLVVDGGWTIV